MASHMDEIIIVCPVCSTELLVTTNSTIEIINVEEYGPHRERKEQRNVRLQRLGVPFGDERELIGQNTQPVKDLSYPIKHMQLHTRPIGSPAGNRGR
jgi:uncharacterized protein YbaR (Trm112 family)